MPQLGETVAEGKIVVWYKSVGDVVSPGDSLFEIETDKTSMDVPTTTAGVLAEIRVRAGDTAPVGAVVAVLSSAASGADRAASTPAGTRRSARVSQDPFNAVKTPKRNFGPATRANGVKATPVARRLAAENEVDLERIPGTGPHGHIVAKDVFAAIASAERVQAPAARAEAPNGAREPPAKPVATALEGAAFEKIPLDGMRRTIARRLQEAKRDVPHFYLSADLAIDRLMALRAELNAQAQGSFRLTVTDFAVKALALALQRVPQANAAWADDHIVRFRHSDVSVAVAVDDGLYTPVIRQVESKSMRVISAELKALAERARSGALLPAEYTGGSATISNLGMYGVKSFTAIVNPPQAVILAIGAVERRPMEGSDGAVRFGDAMTVTVSCDHRVVDGAIGARLLGAFKALMEAPLLLLA